VLVSKAAAMLLLVALGGLVLWAAGVAAPELLEVSVPAFTSGRSPFISSQARCSTVFSHWR